MTSQADRAKQFAKDHPYIAFGGLMIPVTWGVTGDALTALFVGGAVAFGPEIAEGLNDVTSDDEGGDDDRYTNWDADFFDGDGDE